MTSAYEVRPTVYGRVIGLGMGKYRFVGSGVGLMLAALLGPVGIAMAGPAGAKVVQGNASIANRGNRTIIRASDGSIISYSSFNLNRNESVRFIQPSATSRVLNRISSDAPTTLDGSIRSNGIVMFANRAGIIFGPNSVLNVGGIYAAAGNISNKDFTAGLNRFTDVKGTVSNAGQIDANFAALVGDRVINTGTIEASNGVITMVAGNEVTLSPRGGVISVKVDASSPSLGGASGIAAIENSGTIDSKGGSAFMIAGDMYSLAVKNTGTVRGRTIRVEGQGNAGVQVSGTLDASNQHSDGRGGSIKVTGKTVDLVGANLDASGRTGGGQILVGGDYQGHGELRTASNTHVDANSTLNASATDAGNGGKVIVWSDNTTTFAGQISASGGIRSGDGGFIETSGKINLDIRGASIIARARSAGGRAGLWMMDPVNVNIDALPDNGTTTSSSGGTTTWDPDNSASPAIVDVATINMALNSGTNITVITGSVGADAGNINVNAAVSKTAGGDATLTLPAPHNINVNATIGSTAGHLNVDLQANANGAGNVDPNGAAGDVTINSAITTNGGTFSSSGVGYTQAMGGTVDTAGGDASILHTGVVAVNDTLTTGGAGHVLVEGSTFSAAATVTGGSGGIDLRPANSSADIRINNGSGDFDISAATLGNFAMAAGSTLTIGAAGGTGTVLIGSSGDIDLSGQDVNVAIRGDIIRFNGALTFAGVRSLSLTSHGVQDNHAGTDVTGGTLLLTLASGSATLGTNVATLGDSSIAGDLTLDNATDLSFGTLSVGGNLDLRASGTLTGTGDMFVTGNSTFVTRKAGGAAMVVGSSASTFGGSITARSRNNADTADAAGPITINALSGVTLAQVATTGAFSLTSGGNVGSTGIVKTGAATIDAGGGMGGNISISQLQAAGLLTLTTGTGGNVTLTNSTGITIDSSSAIGGNLSLTATTGNIDVQTTSVAGTTVSLTTVASNATVSTATLSGVKDFTVSTAGAGGDAHVAASGLMTITSNVGGTLTFFGGAGVTIASVPTLNLGASIGNGFVAISAPDVNITGVVVAGSAGIILQPDADGKTIGINTSGSDFTLSLTELLNLVTSGTVTIGRVAGTGLTSIGGLGPVDLSATTYSLSLRGGEARFFDTLTLADDKLLTLHTAGVSSPNAGTDVVIGGMSGGVAIDSSGAVDLTTQVARLAAQTSAGSLAVSNTGALDITTIGAVTGVTGATDQDVTISTTGDLMLSEAVVGTGAGDVSLASTGGNITFGNASATANSGTAGSVTLAAAGSIVSPSGALAQVTAGTVNLTATAGDIGAGGALRTDAQTLSVTVGGNADIDNLGTGTLSASGAGSATSTISITHGGLLSVASGHSINAERINLTAADVDFSGDVVAGNTLTISRVTDGTIGLGDSAGDMTISKPDLSHLVTNTLNIGGTTTTGITSSNIAEADVSRLGSMNLLALGTGADITFTGASSTLHNATLRASDSINLNADVVSSLGGLTLIADDNMAADTDGDKINFGNGITLSTSSPSGGDITLRATGGITGVGAITIDSNAALTIENAISSMAGLTLRAKGGIALNGAGSGTDVSITANNGITIADNLTSTSGLVINSDADADGTGVFTLAAGKTINTTGSNLSITCSDIVLDGTIDVGSATLAIAPAVAKTIGLGTAMGDIQISGTELSHITAGTLSLGSELTTLISVDTVAAGDTANISGLITFLADDVEILGAFNTSNASLAIARGSVGNISLGNAVGGLNLTGAELALITTHDLQIGGGNTNTIFVNGVAESDTANVAGAVTLLGNTSIRFISAPSTFKSLTARAHDGILINANLTTTVGDLVLDGNSNNLTENDDSITIASGRTISSAGTLALHATSGGITGLGGLTLLGANGVTLFDNLTTSGTTVIDADHNADNMGTLVVSSGRTISTSGNNLSISAADLTLDGSITANQGAVSITRSASGTIGLGAATGDMTITNSELGRIIATGLTLGGSTINTFTIDGVTAVSSNGIAGITSLISGAGTMTFSGTASVFNALDARASGGMTVGVALSTDNGTLRLDGNSDGVGSEAITLQANVTADIPPAAGASPTVGFNVTFASDVLLDTGSVSVIGRDITFSKKIDSLNSTSRSLVLNSFNSGVTTFNGDVGSTNRLFTLATNNDGITRIGGNIRTNGSIGFNDAVKIYRDSTIDAAAGSGIFFNSTVDTASSSATARSLTLLTARATAAGAVNFPVISFAGSVGSLKPLQNLFLNYDGTMAGDGRTNVPGIATIYARPRDSSGNIVLSPTSPFDMTFNTLGTFRMGHNEKFTSAGSLTINAPTGAFLGDLNSIGNMTVNSPSITLLRREGGRLLESSGVNGHDDGLDFVSGGLINFTSVPVAMGAGINPRFGTVDGGGDVSATLTGFIFQASGAITSSLINSSGTTLRTLDLRSTGPTNTNISDTIAGAIPRESRQNDVGETTTVGQAEFDQIKQLGIVPRNPTAGELVELLTGSATYDDFPRRSPPTAEDYTTVVNRLPSDSVTVLLTAYDSVFNKPLLDDAGKPVKDDKGKVRRVSRSQDIQDALLASVRRFREASKSRSGDIDPSAFRAFLEQNPEEAESLGYIRQLADFLNKLDRVGLTARELTQSKAIILNPVRPRGIRTVQQFEAIIRAEPSRVMR
jgi:trimeric autotransporter adhesin